VIYTADDLPDYADPRDQADHEVQMREHSYRVQFEDVRDGD
jgi:hypothetical protein